VRRSSVATVAEAERWLAHLEEKNWATRDVRQDLARRFARHLGVARVRCLTHRDLNGEHGFFYGNTLRWSGHSRLEFEFARADAIANGEFVMPDGEATLWVA
jgi:hypothetical protein